MDVNLIEIVEIYKKVCYSTVTHKKSKFSICMKKDNNIMIKYLIRDQRSSIRHRTCVHERCPPAVLAERVLSAEDPTSGVKGHSHCSEYVVSVSDHGCPEHRASASHQDPLSSRLGLTEPAHILAEGVGVRACRGTMRLTAATGLETTRRS